MLLSLPLVGYALLFFLFRQSGHQRRDAFLHAATTWGVLVVVVTELLSLPHWLTRANLAISWALIDCILLFSLFQKVSRETWREAVRCWFQVFSPVQEFAETDKGLLLCVGFLIMLVGVTILFSPPNTADARTYHMPRLVHWLKNKTVAFYSTHEVRQLHLQPGAEFIMLQVHGLFGADKFDAFVQWFGLLGSVIGVTLLAQALGAEYRGQALAAVVCATIPQGILQASAVKNDYVAAFWLVAFVYYFLRFRQTPTPVNWLGIGCTLGLACLTKGTSYVFVLGMLLIWSVPWLWTSRTLFLKRLPLIVVLLVGINAGFFVRNYNLTGSPLGPMSYGGQFFKLTNDDMSFASIASNIVRNFSLHLGTPNIAINAAIERRMEAMIRAFGGDPNDSRTTWSLTTFHVPRLSTHESLAGNPIHLVLILLTLVWAVTANWRHLLFPKEVIVYVSGLTAAFVMFCALLRWQPWNTRLHLPLFVLWSPAIGLMLERKCSRAIATSIGFLLILLAWPVALGNQLRPLISYDGSLSVLNRERTELYFMDRPYVLKSYLAAASFVDEKGCRNVGLNLPGNGYEYPLLFLLQGNGKEKIIQNVGVKNSSVVYATNAADFTPCAVVCVGCLKAKDKWDEYLRTVGPASVFADIVVFSTVGTSNAVALDSNQSPGCQAAFSAGWHELERHAEDWWRWTDHRGQINIQSAQAIEVTLQGKLYSIQNPNEVDVFVNSEKITTWRIDWVGFKPFPSLSLHLKAGDNIVEIVSRNAALQALPDPRLLAIAMSNLNLLSSSMALVHCEFAP